ncbi:MAG: uracil-DNA glycosylase family protein [Gemmatimonadaceae bacterium]
MSRPLKLLLAAHRAELAACRRCGYQEAGVLPILSEAATPKVMLVGQAPGKTEVGDRRPFAGRAGRTLFRWLETAGITEAVARKRIYIAAITRCYPGPSPSGRGDRVPSPREREACSGWLDAELAIIRPRIIIPVGRLAIDRFLGTRPLEEVVGRELEARGAWGTSRLFALPHPSGASSWTNAPEHRALVERALALLGAAFLDAGIVRPQRARRSA